MLYFTLVLFVFGHNYSQFSQVTLHYNDHSDGFVGFFVSFGHFENCRDQLLSPGSLLKEILLL